MRVIRGEMGKRAFLSEFDTAQIFRRYNAATVIGLLREVARFDKGRLDWNAIAKKLSTGISGPRECQALWRHIAYRKELADFYADDEQPSDDESDLEFELLPTPVVSSETNVEVVRWVKADMQRFNIGGGKRKGEAKNGETKSKIRDAGLVADPNQDLSGSGRDGSQKRTLNAVGDSSTASPPSGTAGLANPECALSKAAAGQSERRKRKLWSQEEDQELLSAVEEFGEGNWTNILRGSFTHERTAAQLSQRWALIRKRREAVQAAANRITSSPSAEQGNGVQTPPADQCLQTSPAQNGTSPAQNGTNTPQGTSPAQNGTTTADKGSPVQNGATTADKGSPAQNGTSPVQNEGNSASISPFVSPNAAVENGRVNEVVSPSTALASIPASSGCQTQDHASSPPNASPSKGINDASNGSVANPGCGDNVAQNGDGKSIGAITNGGQKQAAPGGAGAAVARSPAGSSTAAEAVGAVQPRSASAKSVSASVGAGRLVASGAVVMTSAAAQTTSVGGNETRQAVTVPSTGVLSLGTTKYVVRSNSRGGSSKAMTGPDPGVQAAAVAAGARIAPASTVLKAAHSGRPGGVPVAKSSLPRETGVGHNSSGGSRGTSGAIVHYITTQKPAQQTKNQAAKANGTSQTSSVARSDSMSPSKSNPTPPPK